MHFRPAQFDRTRMDLVTARLHVIQRSGAAKGGRPTLGFSVEGAEPTGRTASPLPEPPRALGRRRADQRDEQYDKQRGTPSELHHRLSSPKIRRRQPSSSTVQFLCFTLIQPLVHPPSYWLRSSFATQPSYPRSNRSPGSTPPGRRAQAGARGTDRCSRRLRPAERGGSVSVLASIAANHGWTEARPRGTRLADAEPIPAQEGPSVHYSIT
jgi:hypothetical protein